MSLLSDISPAELGLPARFESFRDCQIEAIEQVLEDSKRFQGLCLPTGSGKSIAALGIAKASGLRTCILTSTLGLGSQYHLEFSDCGLVDIRGKSNYTCAGVESRSGREVSCRFGAIDGCRLGGDLGCTYECARYAAKQAQIVSTNYAYWTRINERTRGLELTDKEGGPYPFELLILDEAHAAFEELSKSLQVVVREDWIKHVVKDTAKLRSDAVGRWSVVAAEVLPVISQLLTTSMQDHRKKPSLSGRNKLYELEQLKEALERISTMDPKNWVCEMHEGTKYGRQWVFDCIWPGAWAESRLFLGIKKVVLLSATLRPAALTMLGIKKDQYSFREWPRIFPANRTPIYHLPTVRLNHRTTDEDLQKWLKRIDDIIRSRIGHKGIIHTVSYARQRYLLDNSEFRDIMVANTSDPDSDSAAEVVGKFKEMDTPAVLVSPSFSTGWDFPDDSCRWQIITKLAFPDSRSKVMKERKERNEIYFNYLTMQDLIQACGRGTRHEKDWCEVFCVDDSITWFLMQNKSLAPSWFDVLRRADTPELPTYK